MTPQTILYIILAFLAFDYVFEQVMDFLNLKSSKKSLPAELSDIYNADEYQKSQNYHAERSRFGFLTSALSFIIYFSVIATGFLGFWDHYLTQWVEHDTLRAIIFFASLYIASDILTLPFQYYSTFVIEEKYGFNKSTVKLFFMDKLKSYLLSAIIGGGILWILLTLISAIGSNFWIWFWVVISVIMFLLNMFYTSVFVPLFNKLSPLEEGELKSAIVSYCEKVKFPLTQVFIIDGSKRSTKSNAYFSGIGKKKKIVLFDTLIEKHSTEELVAVLAHEVGHYKKKHIVSGFVLSILQTGLILFILSLFINTSSLSEALGSPILSVHLNLVAFGMLFSPISEVIGIFMNLLSRKNEFEADQYATETYSGKALIKALKNLASHNLSNLTPHPLFAFINYSHPPMLKRIEHIKSLANG